MKKISHRYANCELKQFLIVCDLDGTLLNKQSVLSNNTIENIKLISSLGHKVCLITGRPTQGSIDFYHQLGLNTIMANQNGSYISNPLDKDFQPLVITFSKHILVKLLQNQQLTKYVKNYLIEGVNKGWMLKKPENTTTAEQMLQMFHLNDRDITIINDNLDLIDTDICSTLLHVENLDYFNSIIYEIKNIAPTLIVRNWSLPTDGVIIEINGQFASKETALEFMSSYYGIPLEQCVAVGDGDNDVGMLSKAVWGFAMKNASPAARLSARFMTKHDNDNDGVIRELKKFLKI